MWYFQSKRKKVVKELLSRPGLEPTVTAQHAIIVRTQCDRKFQLSNGAITFAVVVFYASSTTSASSSCLEAAAHYFPVIQYVVAHYGISDSGVGVREEVRLSQLQGQVKGFSGVQDRQHIMTELDALTGDADAQVWLGKKYFWGLQGLPRDEHLARHWFERAVQQNHPEGLYNLGIACLSGTAVSHRSDLIMCEGCPLYDVIW